MTDSSFIVKQIDVKGFDHNFSYLIINGTEGVIIDPTGDLSILKMALSSYPSIQFKYVLLTHGHADHCGNAEFIKTLYNAQIATHPKCHFQHDINLENHQKIKIGSGFIEVIYAPGHSSDSVLFRTSDQLSLLTGDTLFVGCCGFCKPAQMFETMRTVIYPLADSLTVYAGHHYGSTPSDLLGHQKKVNPFLNTKDYSLFLQRIENLI